MIKKLRARGEGDEGFTLIELLVVLLIIGILLAIAIPTYLSVTGGAKKSAAQSNLNTALTAAKAEYTNNNGNYPVLATLVTDLGKAGTSLYYASGASTDSSHLSVDVPTSTNQVAVFAAWDGSTTCFAIADVEAQGGFTGIGSTAGTYWTSFPATTSGACTASAAETGQTWSTSPTSTGVA